MKALSQIRQSLSVFNPLCSWQVGILYSCLLLGVAAPTYAESNIQTLPKISSAELAQQLQVGDVIFIAVKVYPFRQVSKATLSWTNHVGVVVETGDEASKEVMIAESTFPVSRRSELSKFLARSDAGRVAVSRLKHDWTMEERQRLQHATEQRMGIWYDSGFNLESKRQFCSRFVRESIEDATGIALGEISNFDTLFKHNPEANLKFWRLWYFGRIPWNRLTVTPASLLQDTRMQAVFDGYITSKSTH